MNKIQILFTYSVFLPGFALSQLDGLVLDASDVGRCDNLVSEFTL